MHGWIVTWSRGGPTLVWDAVGEWSRVDDPTTVPHIYMAEQFAKNSLRYHAPPVPTNIEARRVQRVTIEINRTASVVKWFKSWVPYLA